MSACPVNVSFRPGAKALFALMVMVLSAALPNSQAAPVTAGSGPALESVAGSAGSFGPVWSADGRTVTFLSRARNLTEELVSGRCLNLFQRDLATGQLVLISVDPSGRAGGNGDSFLPSVSSDGLVIAFESAASNLDMADQNNGSDIYVHDRATGRTRLVSRAWDAATSGDGPSRSPQISADGRYVTFASSASNLVPNDRNGASDVFLHDLQTGETTLLSVTADRVGSADGASDSPTISADGGIVAFVSRATNLVLGVTNRAGEVYVRRVREGTTLWAGVSHLAGQRDRAPVRASEPVLSADGRYLAFKPSAAGVVRWDLSRATNTVLVEYPLVSSGHWVALSVLEDNPRYRVLPAALRELPLSLSADGRYAVVALVGDQTGREMVYRIDFETFASYLETRPEPNVYVTNHAPRLEMLLESAGPSSWAGRPFRQLVASPDASRLLVTTDLGAWDADVLVGGAQIFLADSNTLPRLVSTNRLGRPGSDLSAGLPALSPDGRTLAYETADPLVIGDGNQQPDVYLRNLDSGATTLVSERLDARPSQTLGVAEPILPNGVSGDGRWLLFSSSERPAGDAVQARDQYLWLRDQVNSTNQLLHPEGLARSQFGMFSHDARFVAFLSRDLAAYRDVVVRWDRQTDERWSAQTGFPLGLFLPAPARGLRQPKFNLSRDGQKLAYTEATTGNLRVRDFLAETNFPVLTESGGPITLETTPIFSPNARWLAFQSSGLLTTNNRPGLYLWDLQEGRGEWLSGLIAGYTVTNSVAFSLDSRFIVFARDGQIVRRDLTAASRTERVVAPLSGRNPDVSGDGRYVVAEVTSGAFSQVMRFDLQTGVEDLVSRSRRTGDGGNGPSVTPRISEDGRYVIFASRAADLVENDTNGVSDVFVRDLLLGTTLLASVNRAGTSSGNGPSSGPVLAADGRTVLFHSFASDLIEQDHNERRDVFVLRLRGADSDRDGLDDDWEQAYFSSLARDGAGDFDGDGVSDRAEFLAGTSPIQDGSVFRVMTLGLPAGGGVRVMWNAVPGRAYRVEFKDALESGPWQALAEAVVASAGTATLDDRATVGSSRFYRVVALP